MMARVAFLAFPWLAAAAGIAWLWSTASALPLLPLRRVVAAALAVLAATQAVARESREWADRRDEFRPEAQAEALSLRELLHGRSYLSLDMIGYATATPTLGRPLAVPPGQASPFGDFARRQRRAHRALSTNSPECWSALFELYPDLEYLLTPAPEARVERALWHQRLGAVTPEAVRDTLAGMGALEARSRPEATSCWTRCDRRAGAAEPAFRRLGWASAANSRPSPRLYNPPASP